MAEVLFKKVDYTLRKLVEDISMGEIGLPDVQRSLARQQSVRSLRRHVPGIPLVVDGQQRLTSLYAVIKAVPVVDKEFRSHHIRIAFHLREEKFEVTNPTIGKDAEWISDISELWKPDINTYTFAKEFLQRFKEGHEVSENEEDEIVSSIPRQEKLLDYPPLALQPLSASQSRPAIAG